MQDAPRKHRPASKTPGAWAGSIVSTDEDGVQVLVSQEQWAKTRFILLNLEEEFEKETPKFSHKQLLSDRGFLIYVARTYLAMVPYLKGIHLTIEHWRDDRDIRGWPDQEGIAHTNMIFWRVELVAPGPVYPNAIIKQTHMTCKAHKIKIDVYT